MDSFLLQISLVLDTLYRSSVVYGLVGYHWLTWAWDIGCSFTYTTVCGAINAHRDKEYIFLSRNSCPWQRYVQHDELNMIRTQYPLIYTANDCHFEYPSSKNTATNTFSSVVTAEILNNDETILFDLSGFFHKVTWNSGGAPSLFEVVLMYCLENSLIFSLDRLHKFTLKVFTTDGENHSISLESELANNEFVKWTNNVSSDEDEA